MLKKMDFHRVVEDACQQILASASQHEAEYVQASDRIAVERKELELRKTALEQEFQTRTAALEQEFAQKTAALDADRAKFEEERMQFAHRTGQGDVISLNLGGERFVDVKRSTLCQCEDSMLAKMFSGRWDEQLDRDSAGRVLIDFNPALAMPLIDFLRMQKVDPPGNAGKSKLNVPHELEADCELILKYFGLENFVGFDRAIDTKWHWAKGENMKLSEDMMEVSRNWPHPIFGTLQLESGKAMWAVKWIGGNIVVGIGTLRTQPKGTPPYGDTALVYSPATGTIDGAANQKNLKIATPNTVIGIALDIQASSVSFYRDGEYVADMDTTCLRHGPYIPVLGLWGAEGQARLISTTSVHVAGNTM